MSSQRKSIAPQIVDQASEWFVLMREPSVSNSDRKAFSEWLRASPAHLGVYLDIAKLWGDTADISARVDVGAASELSVNVCRIAPDPHPSRDSKEQSDNRSRWPGIKQQHSRFLALAAGVLIVLIGVGAWFNVAHEPTYSTGIGEERVITLKDGSIVQLNSRSTLTVRLSRRRREVDLTQGQALFQVAHDKSRPFIVYAGGAAIRALGTQFDVNLKQSATVVTVVEGRVQVDSVSTFLFSHLVSRLYNYPTTDTDAASPTEQVTTPGTRRQGAASDVTMFLLAGEQATVDHSGIVTAVPKANVAAVTSWLHQELVFQGEALRDVIDEFNRFSQTQIILADPSLDDLRINAVFHTTNPDSLVRFISRVEGIQVSRSGDEIKIYRKH